MVDYLLYAGIVSNVIAFIPLLYMALRVETHYTNFHTASWNLYILGGVGFLLFLFPYNGEDASITYSDINVSLWLLLISYAVLITIIGRRWNGNLIRNLGSSRLILSILVTSFIAQYFGLIEAVSIGIILVIAYVSLYLIMRILHSHVLSR